MKVRTKFTIWVALATLFVTSLFSIYILFEVREEVSEAIDYEFEEIAQKLFKEIEAASNGSAQINTLHYSYPLDRFWLRFSVHQGEILFETDLAQKTDLPIQKMGKSYFVKSNMPHKFIKIPPSEQEDVDEFGGDIVKFQVRFFQREIHGVKYDLLIGQPLLLVNMEFREVFFELSLGIAITIFVVFIVAYVLTGRMLEPINVINRQIKTIRETSLDSRIPVGKSKDELYNLSMELNFMFDRLQYSFEKQREFIGNASHEMKSPLTILMLGHEELLADNLPEKARFELEKQLNTMRRLNKLIRDLLSIANLEQKDRLDRQNVRLDQLLNSILNDFKDIIKTNTVELITDIAPITISADYEKLRRLFINLIDNAIKYNLPENGYIRIEAKENSGTAQVKVVNSAHPIPEEDLPQIFNQFFRVEKSRSVAYGGSGLGLTIAKRIVQMHGGSITASNGEQSVEFVVTLMK